MAAYSMDLRLLVLRDADAGLPSDELAEKYSVSRAWVDRLKQRRRETGEVAPRKQTRWRQRILHAQLMELAALIRERPDRTLAELQEALRTPTSLPTLCRTIKRGVVARIVTGPHDTHRRDPHLPMRYDTGRPRAVIRLRISQPRTTSLPNCPTIRSRRWSGLLA